MKPTKLTEKPWVESSISKRGTLMLQTDVGLMSCKEAATILGVRYGTFYERIRKCGRYASLSYINRKLFI